MNQRVNPDYKNSLINNTYNEDGQNAIQNEIYNQVTNVVSSFFSKMDQKNTHYRQKSKSEMGFAH
jgi:hypothetical protein